jgi:hypothetical protein
MKQSDVVDRRERGFCAREVLGRNIEGGRITYLGERRESGERVVIKHFSFARSDAGWAGYRAHERELELLQQLDHRAIPNFVDAFPVDDGFWLVQEYVEAPALSARRYWSFEEVVDIAVELLEILVELQDRHPPILHRDLKPDNVLCDESGQVYLIDFGLARAASEPGKAATMSAGTPGFMAPEQFFGREVDEATDLYGLGATLFALLGGVASDRIQDHVDTAFRFDFEPVEEEAPQWFLQWLQTMLAPERTERFDDARQALSELRRLRDASASLTSVAESNAAALERERRESVSRPASSGSEAAPESGGGGLVALVVGLFITASSLAIGVWVYVMVEDGTFLEESVSAIDNIVREMPESGGRFWCDGEWTLEGGVDGAPSTLSRIDAGPGCRLHMSGVDVTNMIYTDAGAVLHLEDGEVTRLDLDGASATLERVRLDELRFSREKNASGEEVPGSATVRDVTIRERLGLDDGASLQGEKLSVAGYIRVDGGARLVVEELEASVDTWISGEGTTARIDRGEFQKDFGVRGGATVRGAAVEVAGRVNILQGAAVMLDAPDIQGRLTVADRGLLVMREPLLAGGIRKRGTVEILEAGEDLEAYFERVLGEHRARLAARDEREKREKRREEIATAIREKGCAALTSCARQDSSLDGRLRVSIDVDERGRAKLARSTTSSACLERTVASMRLEAGVSGELTCTLDIGRESGALMARVVRARFAAEE